MIDINEEMIEAAASAFAAAGAAGKAGPGNVEAWRAAIEAAAEIIEQQHVQPIEQALAESEAQVAELGRRLYAATRKDAE